MLPNYNTRRSSVVFNPRGGVFGGLGEETGGGANEPGEGGNIPGGGGYDSAAADADAIAAQIALEASSKQAYEAAAAQAAAQAQAAISTAKSIRSALSVVPVIGTLLTVFEAIGNIVSDIGKSKTQPAYAANQAAASRALAEAQALAAGPGGDSRLLAQVTAIQNSLANLDATKMGGSQAAVTQLYRTYAKREPDPGALVYWSNTFGPTITADEVFQFQQVLYANEPNLRPVATTTARTSNNLALPIIAAVAGFLIFGA